MSSRLTVVTPDDAFVPVAGYESLYAVNRKGQVKRLSVSRSCGKSMRTYQERLLKPCPNQRGYLILRLTSMGGSRRLFGLHQIVARAFVPGYADGLEPNHKDLDKTNCAASNLEWVTKRGNRLHALESGCGVSGEDSPHTKLGAHEVQEIRLLASTGFYTKKLLGEMFGVTGTQIANIVSNRKWKYLNQNG